MQEPFHEVRAEKRCIKCIISAWKNFSCRKGYMVRKQPRRLYKSAIEFYQQVPDSLRSLLLSLSSEFLRMREELAQYEASGSNMAPVR